MHEGVSAIIAEIGIILVIAASCALLARILRLPILIGYVGAGLLLGPILGHVGVNPGLIQESQHIAFTFLLFLVGLETDWRDARYQLHSGSIVAGIQMVSSFIFGLVVAYLFGLNLLTAIFLGLCLTFTSGLISIKLLSEQHDLTSMHGRLTASVLVIQDIFAVVVLAIMQGYSHRYNLTLGQEVTFLIMKGVAIAVIFLTASRVILPKLFSFVAKSSELLVLTSLAWCFAGTTLFQLCNLPLEAGALLAGLSLATLPYGIETVSKIRSLRDFFLVFFFINVGINLVLPAPAYISITLALIFGATIARPLINYITLSLSGYRTRTAFLTSISQGSISELAIIFTVVGAESFHLSQQLISAISVALFASICISAFQVTYRQQIYHALQPILKLTERGHHRHTALITGSLEKSLENHVVIFGYHKMGYHILQQVLKHKEKVLVVDFNPEVVNRLRESGIQAIYGDIEDEQIFYTTNLTKASLVISTIPHKEETIFLLETAHKLNSQLPVIVTSKTVEDALHYYELRAAYVLLPHLLASEHIAELIHHHRHGSIHKLAAQKTEELTTLQNTQNSLFSD